MSASPERAKTVPAPIPVGAVIGGKYRLDQLLAEGGMGLVYRGWHLVLDHPVAVKIVRPELAYRTDAVARFLDEARAVARLRGDHVAHVLDSGCIKNGPPYMVLEYLEGCDLRAVIDSEGPLDIPRAVDLILQTCEALAEAHAQGIVHRDVKPENLFLAHRPDGTETLKVLDFGISKRMDRESGRSFTMQGQSLGSPHYMAPEQMSTPSQVDARADIWSLGVVAFEMLSGKVPFDGETVPTVCAQVLCRSARLLSTVRRDAPRALEAVVARCLSKKPSQRYANVKELAAALAPFATPEGARSVLRVRRLFGENVPDDAAAANRLQERTPSARVHSTTETDFRLPRRPLWPIAAVVAAAAVAALGIRNWDDVERTALNAAAAFSAPAGARELPVERVSAAPALPAAPTVSPAPERPTPVIGASPQIHAAQPESPSLAAAPVAAPPKPRAATVKARWKPRVVAVPEPREVTPEPAPKREPLRGLSELRAPIPIQPFGPAPRDAEVDLEAASESPLQLEGANAPEMAEMPQ